MAGVFTPLSSEAGRDTVPSTAPCVQILERPSEKRSFLGVCDAGRCIIRLAKYRWGWMFLQAAVDMHLLRGVGKLWAWTQSFH